MSYCRFLSATNARRCYGKPGMKSDVYVFGSHKLECYGPLKMPPEVVPFSKYHWFSTDSFEEMLRHLLDLRQMGYKVPKYATRRLKQNARKYKLYSKKNPNLLLGDDQ